MSSDPRAAGRGRGPRTKKIGKIMIGASNMDLLDMQNSKKILPRPGNAMKCSKIAKNKIKKLLKQITNEKMFVVSSQTTKLGLGASNLDVLEAQNSEMMLLGPKHVIKNSKKSKTQQKKN